MRDLKQKVAKGAVWTLCEKLSCQTVTFVVGMILSRLLTPDDYGTVALMGIFFAVAQVLVDGGFGNALIQKKDADDLDFNSVFYLNVFLSLAVYAVLFFAAPLIARFYNDPILIKLVRVAGLSLIFNAVGAIQNAELTKKMLFHLSFRVSLVATVASAVCGVSLAFSGFGVWALVYSSLMSSFAGVIARWFIIAWRPKAMFSFSRLKPLWDYGWKMSLSSLLDQFFLNLNNLLIGKVYTKADLAFVNKGYSLPKLVMNEVDSTIGRVSFPALVQMQNDRIKLRDAMRRMMICSTFLVFPLMVLVAACAESELLLLFGGQWTFAAPYMMLACFVFALQPLHTVNLKGIMALGRSDIFLKLEIAKKLLKLLFILLFLKSGVFPFMCASALALGPLSVVLNAWPNRKLIDYPIKMQVMDILPTILVCVAEAAVVFGVDFAMESAARAAGAAFPAGWRLNLWLAAKLCLQFVSGMVTFFGLAWRLRLKPMAEYLQMIPCGVKAKAPVFFNKLERRFGV